MAEMVAVALWAGAIGGIVAIAIAVARPSKRRVALLVAAVLFLPIGVLGILSIGAVFLALSLGCIIAAALSRGPDSDERSAVPQ